MTETTYNGWTNYETWAVALWIDNEQGSYRYWRDQVREHRKAAPTCRQVAGGLWTPEEAAKIKLADQLKDEIRDAAPMTEPSLFSDLLGAALDEVNWFEIAGNWLSDEGPPEQPPAPAIFSYSRAQAIADGVLIDATKTAEEAGLKYPTALTAAVWAQCVKVPEEAEGQDERGRLWDVLWILKTAIQQSGHTNTVPFSVLVNNDRRGPRPVRLKALCGLGDTTEPIITVMLPEED